MQLRENPRLNPLTAGEYEVDLTSFENIGNDNRVWEWLIGLGTFRSGCWLRHCVAVMLFHLSKCSRKSRHGAEQSEQIEIELPRRSAP